MAKKMKDMSKKMTGKFKSKLEDMRQDIESQLGGVTGQAQHLQEQVREPLLKLVDELESNYRKQLHRMQGEYDKQITKLLELQKKMAGHLANVESSAKKIKAKTLKKIKPKSKKKAEKSASKTPSKPIISKPPSKVSSKKSTESKKTTAGKKASVASELAQIKGIGPVTLKKLQAAGIDQLSQLADPSKAEQVALESFKRVASFSTWSEQAGKLLK